MSPDGRRRSREHWTDTMEAGPPDPPAHVHRLPRSVRVALAGLVAAVFLLLVALGLMAVYVYQANQYVQGRGEFRDREQQRLEEQIRRSTCDLLDQLPEGGLLDRPRVKYGCGPGIPISSLSPEEQAQLTSRAPRNVAPSSAAPEPTPAAPTAAAPFSGGATGPPASSTVPPAPPRPTLTPTTSAKPSTARPLTDPLCDVLTSVLKEIPCSSD